MYSHVQSITWCMSEFTHRPNTLPSHCALWNPAPNADYWSDYDPPLAMKDSLAHSFTRSRTRGKREPLITIIDCMYDRHSSDAERAIRLLRMGMHEKRTRRQLRSNARIFATYQHVSRCRFLVARLDCPAKYVVICSLRPITFSELRTESSREHTPRVSWCHSTNAIFREHHESARPFRFADPLELNSGPER